MGREIPYQPMGKPKRVSFERMQEVLKKHSQKPTQLQVPIPPKWERVAADAMESTDGYRVFRERNESAGMVSHRYMAFFGKSGGSRMSQCVGSFVSFEQAKLGCDAHRQSTLRPAEPLRSPEQAASVAEKEPDVAAAGGA